MRKYPRKQSLLGTSDDRRVLSEKQDRERLSYLQLIELAVVAAFRKAKIPLPGIRAARDYMKRELKSQHPFAEFQFKRFGVSRSPSSRRADGRSS